jgi:hypothetical protein
LSVALTCLLGRTSKPLLFVDVDGVLNPYPNCPPGFEEYELFAEDDEPVRLARVHGAWLRELSGSFALVWASAWGDDANRLVCPHFGIPEMPVVAFPPTPFDPASKVRAIDAVVGDRSAAWLETSSRPKRSDGQPSDPIRRSSSRWTRPPG